MQIFTEIIPAFKNGGVDSGVKQIGKSALQVAGSVGGWGIGGRLGSKTGIANGNGNLPRGGAGGGGGI